MKKIIMAFCAGFLICATLAAQDWQTDFSTSLEMAKEAEKPIIMVFQGSDWCAPCMKLDREIWSTEAFKTHAAENYILLQVDFPRRKKNRLTKAQAAANGALAETYNQSGIFPFVVVLDPDKKVLGQAGYEKVAPSEYIQKLDAFIQ